MYVLLFFFFKQKTAYEMRISDWSSDVCSSDLARLPATAASTTEPSGETARAFLTETVTEDFVSRYLWKSSALIFSPLTVARSPLPPRPQPATNKRSEERSVGQGCVSSCRSRGSR